MGIERLQRHQWSFDRIREQGKQAAVRIGTAVNSRILRPTKPTEQLPNWEEQTAELKRFIAANPQRNEAGELQYLVGCGLSVTLVTRELRKHGDLDIIALKYEDRCLWEKQGVDTATPQMFWAYMIFDPGFLERTARTVSVRESGGPPFVEIVHPGVTLVQKTLNQMGGQIRDKDKTDMEAIVRHWKEKENFTPDWNPVITTAIYALPYKRQQEAKEQLRKRFRLEFPLEQRE